MILTSIKSLRFCPREKFGGLKRSSLTVARRWTQSYIKLAVFDLDYTVWPANADIDFMRPLQRVPSESGDKKTRVYDLRNREVTIYPEMEKIFKFLTDKEITIAISSKDRNPEVRFRGLYHTVVHTVWL